MKSLTQYINEKSWDKYITTTFKNSDKNAIYDYVAGYTVGVNGDLRKNNIKGSKTVLT